MPNLLCLNNAIDSHQVFWFGEKKNKKKRRRGQYYIYDIEIAQKFPLILCRQIVSVTLLSLRGRWNSSREYRVWYATLRHIDQNCYARPVGTSFYLSTFVFYHLLFALPLTFVYIRIVTCHWSQWTQRLPLGR